MFITPGGNLLKKEDKFFEETDENGEKRYKIYVEYNLVPEDEAKHYYSYYQEQLLQKGKDAEFKINSIPVPLPIIVEPIEPAIQTFVPPTGPISKGYSLIEQPINYTSQHGGPAVIGDKLFASNAVHKPIYATGYNNQLVEQTLNDPLGDETQNPEVTRIIRNIMNQGNTHAGAFQKYNLQGHIYEGYITEDANGNQYLAVDAANFKAQQS